MHWTNEKSILKAKQGAQKWTNFVRNEKFFFAIGYLSSYMALNAGQFRHR